MLMEKIDVLKQKLEEQINRNESYSNIYETSVEIDQLLIEYYKEVKSRCM